MPLCSNFEFLQGELESLEVISYGACEVLYMYVVYKFTVTGNKQVDIRSLLFHYFIEFVSCSNLSLGWLNLCPSCTVCKILWDLDRSHVFLCCPILFTPFTY
jgi:hypothetical protein